MKLTTTGPWLFAISCVLLLGACGGDDDSPAGDASAFDAAPSPDAPPAPSSACGNGVPDDGELCDDGNDDDQDSCATDCTPAQAFWDYDQTLLDLIETWDIPGAAIAVTYQGRLVLARGYGLADVEAGARVARDDMFRIASLSKLVTAAAVLKLVEQDRIDLDAPAFGYLPDLPAPGGATEDPRLATITVRQLLHHAGGWDREVSYDPMFMSTYIAGQLGEPAPSSADMVVRWMRGQPLDFDPGSRFAYSNFGYAVLGRIIEAVTEQPYDTWVQHNVLAPAGITRMRIGHTRLEDRADGEVRYYGFSGEPLATESVFPDVDGSVPWPYGGWYQESLDAHGGWIASAVDLSRFLLAIDGRDTYADIINAGSVAAMTARPELPDWDFTAYWYGMGVSVRPSGGDANWWHNGALPGTATIFVRSYHGFTWVALFNSRPADQSFFGAMDSTMWTALNTVESWPDYDLFDQYE